MSNFNLSNVKTDTWVRLAMCILVVVMMILSYFIDGEKLYDMAKNAFYIVTLFVSFWKNNSFTHAAQQGDELMEYIKNGGNKNG